MHSEQWYQIRLSKHFQEKYGDMEETVGFYVNPADNKWLFEIPEQGISVLLICHEDGTVTEEWSGVRRHVFK